MRRGELRTTGETTYFIYFLAYHQRGGGAGLHFSWANCTSQNRTCVLGAMPPRAVGADTLCASLAPDSSATVVALESRTVGPGSGSVDFHALTAMELVATDEELTALLAAPPVATGSAGAATPRFFAEPRERAVRMFDRMPASWARAGEQAALALNASVGEFFTFQLGVFAPTANLSRFNVQFQRGTPVHQNKQQVNKSPPSSILMSKEICLHYKSIS